MTRPFGGALQVGACSANHDSTSKSSSDCRTVAEARGSRKDRPKGCAVARNGSCPQVLLLRSRDVEQGGIRKSSREEKTGVCDSRCRGPPKHQLCAPGRSTPGRNICAPTRSVGSMNNAATKPDSKRVSDAINMMRKACSANFTTSGKRCGANVQDEKHRSCPCESQRVEVLGLRSRPWKHSS